MLNRYFEINENGHNIRCKIYYQDIHNIKRSVVFVHGFGGHKDNGAAERFAERMISKHKDTSLITFNLPCHGDDVKKKLSLTDCNDYIDMVISYIKNKLCVDEIFSYATSFGGYLTLKYISEHGSPFKRTALRCPAVNMEEVIEKIIDMTADKEKLRKGKDIAIGFDRKITIGNQFIEEIKNNKIDKLDFIDYAEDILIIHGTADEIVPFDVTNEFADNNIIEFVSVEGADHRFHDPKMMDQAIKHILDFYKL